ncbi:MAG: DUF4625 domain-containing protein [Tannerella sp.]|jgi:hypothetical protein|nr:DUF4625 domain-containing protein [Tannerella sp.]
MNTTNKFLLSAIIAIASTLGFTSCDDDGDTTPPSINLISPTNGEKIQIGKVIHFEVELSDDEMLKSYKVEIHNNIEDPHGHEMALKASEVTDKNYFSFQKTWNISDKRNTTPHEHIDIPEGVTAGEYHLMVYCTDAAGNESHVASKIILTNEEIEDEHDH